MKLAEALQERADLNARLGNISGRLCNNALVQEGEAPAEDPAALLSEFEDDVKRLRELTARINLTNCKTVVDGSDGRTMTELLAEKDALLRLVSMYRDLVGWSSQTASRVRYSEIKIKSALDVRAIQKRADDTAKELRRIDNLIQAANWQTELL